MGIICVIACTVTVWLSLPTASSIGGISLLSPAFRITPVSSFGANPFAITRIVYVPGTRDENAYRPALVVAASSWVRVASLIRVTAAPGITAPVVSCTVPVTVAVVWACSPAGQRLIANSAIRTRTLPMRPKEWLDSIRSELAPDHDIAVSRTDVLLLGLFIMPPELLSNLL